MPQQLTATFTFTVIGALQITSGQPPAAVQGQPYSFQFTAAGGQAPYAWAATGLPAGLSLSPAGMLAGTPTVSGAFAVSVTVADAGA